MRLRMEYFDQNESVAKQLPREGLVVATPKSCDSPLLWHLVQLDAPVVYEQVEHTLLLLAARWERYPIGGTERASVFTLLVPSSSSTVTNGFSHEHFPHIAWGMCHVVGA